MNRVDELYEMIAAVDGDVDSIADSFIEDLNAAIQRYKNENQKQKDAEALAEHIQAFVKMYYPEAAGKITGNDIIKIFNLSENILSEAEKIKDFIPKVEENKTLADMIAAMGW